MGTYPALLFKTGEYGAVEEHTLRAMEIGKEAGEDVTKTEHLLEKIRAKK